MSYGHISNFIFYSLTYKLSSNVKQEILQKSETRKQQQREFNRMKRVNEQKTVCEHFPYSSLDNDAIRAMICKPASTQVLKSGISSDNSKLKELQVVNNKLNDLISELMENIMLVIEKVKIIEC